MSIGTGTVAEKMASKSLAVVAVAVSFVLLVLVEAGSASTADTGTGITMPHSQLRQVSFGLLDFLSLTSRPL